MNKRFFKAYKIAVALMTDNRLASLTSDSKRRRLAFAILKEAVEARDLKSIGPLLAWQFVSGAGGEAPRDLVKRNPERAALDTLMRQMNLDERSARSNLGAIATAVSESLEKAYNTFANTFGQDALEEAYTKLALDQIIYTASWESGLTTIEQAKRDASALVSTTMRNDMLDAIRVQKNRSRLEREFGTNQDMNPEDDELVFDGNTILSTRPSAKLRDAILDIIDTPQATREIVNHSHSALRVSNASSARDFMTAVRECSVFATASKFSVGTRNDILALALVLPHTKKRLKRPSRYETCMAVFEYVKAQAMSGGGDGKVTPEIVRSVLNESRVPAQDPQGTAKALNSTQVNSMAANAEKYIDTAYAILLRILVKMTAGIESGMGDSCEKNLAKLSDRVELEKIRRKLEIPRSVNWDR